MSQNENKGGFAIGVVLGGIIGAGIAYLLSSDDQEETRRMLKKKGKMLLKNISDLKDEAMEKGEEIGEAVSGRVVEFKDNASEIIGDKVKEVGESAQDTIDDLSKSARKFERSAEKEIGKTQNSIKKFFVKKGKPLVKR